MSKIKQFIEALNQAYTDRGVNGVSRIRPIGPDQYAVLCEFDTGVERYVIFNDEQGYMTFVRDYTINEYIREHGEPR